MFMLHLYVCILIAISTHAIGADTINDPTLLWGPYRPNLYFGIRPRMPKTLLMGLMWARVEDGIFDERGEQQLLVLNGSMRKMRANRLLDLRHTCEQNEGMAGYGWTEYEPRKGGSQIIHDVTNNLDLTIRMTKTPRTPESNDWVVRIKGAPRDEGKPFNTTVIFYVAMENMQPPSASQPRLSHLECGTSRSLAGTVKCRGFAPALRRFGLSVRSPRASKAQTFLTSTLVSEDLIWQAKSVFKDLPASLPPSEDGISNIHFVQQLMDGAFEFDILFSTALKRQEMSSAAITNNIKGVLSSFSSHFDRAFTPQPPFNTEAFKEFSKYLLSNLLGGMGYFYGDSKVDTAHTSEYNESEPNFWESAAEARSQMAVESTPQYGLTSFVPSRPFFPRGFLWDEGFHLLLVLEWDVDLALQIVFSWFATMNEDGWVAREQILGPEARSKVPPEFQVQDPHYANPPTMFLVVSRFVELASGQARYLGVKSHYLNNAKEFKKLIQTLYPALKKHYDWFRRTQAGDMDSYTRPGQGAFEGYRWRGRTPKYTLTSGLDDYPRAEPPHPGELHVDALSWVGSMAQALSEVATFLGETNDQVTFSAQREKIQQSIDNLHWSESEQAYCDATVVDGAHKLVCHKGYVSLLPFLVGLLDPEHPHLGAVLDQIRQEGELWSSFGIRSLSRKDHLYGTGDNYWRGPIWININFLIIQQLYHLAISPGKHQDVARETYNELRRTITTTVYESWRSTGFAWEQYNPDTGAGQRTQHFTGWTALIVKILAMPELGQYSHSPHASITSQLIANPVFWAFGLASFVLIFRKRLQRLWMSRRKWDKMGKD